MKLSHHFASILLGLALLAVVGRVAPHVLTSSIGAATLAALLWTASIRMLRFV